jgi:predicted transcriptional regulator of viral defense system
MNRENEVLELAREYGILKAKDLEAAGISRNYLYQLQQRGLLEKRARGIYALPDTAYTEHSQLAEVAKRVPRSVVCLISALSFHGISTQIPHEIWIAVHRASWRPRIDYPPLNLTYLSGDSYTHGIQSHDLDGVVVKVYSPAKTVADCFKFRNKVGLDVAIEALRECWRAKRATMDEITTAAKVNRVFAVMRPYIEATV